MNSAMNNGSVKCLILVLVNRGNVTVKHVQNKNLQILQNGDNIKHATFSLFVSSYFNGHGYAACSTIQAQNIPTRIIFNNK